MFIMLEKGCGHSATRFDALCIAVLHGAVFDACAMLPADIPTCIDSARMIPPSGIPQPYCGPPIGWDALWSAWNTDPWLLAGLFVAGVALFRMGSGRDHAALNLRIIALAVLLFVSPLCAATTTLLGARTLHHLLILLVLAPLLARRFPRAPGTALGWAVPALLVMAIWYLPRIYSLAWRSDAVYWALQMAAILSAWGFWARLEARPVCSDARPAPFADAAAGLALVAVAMGMIGALLTFAPDAKFVEHLATSPMMGLSALDDQRLAGLMMWVLAMLPLGVIAGWHVHRGWQREARR